MPSAYPGALDALSTSSANGTTSNDTHPALHNDANAAINAIQSTLGIDPQGSEATVAARLAALEAAPGGGISEPITSARFTRQTSPISAAATGEAKLNFRDIARAGLAAVRADVGDELILLPSMTHPLLTGAWVITPNMTTAKGSASNIYGGGSASTLGNSIGAIKILSAGSAGSEASWYSGEFVVRDGSSFGDGYLAYGFCGVEDASYGSGATGAVVQTGLYASGAAATNGNRNSGRSATIEYNTVQGDTNWMLAVHNGTDVATADTGVPFAAQSAIFWMIHSPRGGSATYAFVCDLTNGVRGNATLARNTGSTALARITRVVTRTSGSRSVTFGSFFVLHGGAI